MNKITIILKESGTVADLKMNFKLYQKSAQNVLLNILVPKSILGDKLCSQYLKSDGDVATENGTYTAVKIGETYIKRDGQIGKTQSYYVRYLKDVQLADGEYQVFERMFPGEFTLYSGTGASAPKLVTNVVNILNNITTDEEGQKIINEPTILSLITSQECQIPVEPSTNLDVDPPTEPTDFDLLGGQMNDMVQKINSKTDYKESMRKYNLLEPLPNTVMYAKDGYKTIGVHFYNETYKVPVNTQDKVNKVGEVYVTNMRPHETELYQAYQDEVFSFDSGIVKRSLLINTVQQAIGHYTVLSIGEWQTVGVEYFEALQDDIDKNLAEINALKGRSSRYVVHFGENTEPSQEQLLTAFEEASGLEEPIDGTTLIDMDNNKEYTFFETSGEWTDRGASTVSAFTNTSAGVIQGSEEDGHVKAVNGKGKVSGWEKVKEDIQTNKEAIETKTNKEDLQKVAVDKTLSEGENSVTETTKYKNLTDNSITEETQKLRGMEGVSVVKTEDGVAVGLDAQTTQKLGEVDVNAQEIEKIKEDYIPKENIDKSVVTDTSFEVGETGVLQQTETTTDLKDGTKTSRQKTAIPVVEGKARLILPQEQDTLKELKEWKSSMQGEALSWQVNLDELPQSETSSIEVQNFLMQKYHEDVGQDVEPLDQTTLADDNLGVTYKWYSNHNAWFLTHGSPNSIASNNMYDEGGNLTSAGYTGTIVGSNRKFHVFVETNGEGSVNGLDELEQKVLDNDNAISQEARDRSQAIKNEQDRATAAEKANADKIAKKVSNTTKVAGKPLTGDVDLELITIKINGTPVGTYNGKEVKEIDISVPTKTSNIENDGDGSKINGNADPYAKVSQIPTDNSQLGNTAGYSKEADLEALKSRVQALEQHPFLSKVQYDAATDTFTI